MFDFDNLGMFKFEFISSICFFFGVKKTSSNECLHTDFDEGDTIYFSLEAIMRFR